MCQGHRTHTIYITDYDHFESLANYIHFTCTLHLIVTVSRRKDANNQHAETGIRLHSILEAFNRCTICTVRKPGLVHPSRGHGGCSSGMVAGGRSRLHRQRAEDWGTERERFVSTAVRGWNHKTSHRKGNWANPKEHNLMQVDLINQKESN